MNITFLIGNGFDLSGGLRTSYKDFYEWYCDKPSSEKQDDSDTIKQFKAKIRSEVFGNKKGTEGSDIWSDFEIGLGKYTGNDALTVESFIECYRDAMDQMIRFLKDAEKSYDQSLITNKAVSEFKKSIPNFYKKLYPETKDLFESMLKTEDRATSSTINFISFNYTAILDSFINALRTDYYIRDMLPQGSVHATKVNRNVLHIHGDLRTQPIFGVEDIEDVANPTFLQNQIINNSLIKKNNVEYLKQQYYSTAEALLRKSKIIIIYGMSLGRSDSIWWRKIISWLMDDKSRQLIIFWYSEDVNNNLSVDIITETERIKNSLLSYCKAVPEIKATISDRINVIINETDILKIPSIQ